MSDRCPECESETGCINEDGSVEPSDAVVGWASVGVVAAGRDNEEDGTEDCTAVSKVDEQANGTVWEEDAGCGPKTPPGDGTVNETSDWTIDQAGAEGGTTDEMVG